MSVFFHCTADRKKHFSARSNPTDIRIISVDEKWMSRVDVEREKLSAVHAEAANNRVVNRTLTAV